jgi:hypothetical protein
MKYLKKFKIHESQNNQNEFDIGIIVDSVIDFIDDGRKILFKSSVENMTYEDYVSKNDNYHNFRPVINAGNRVTGSFQIVFQNISDYQDFLTVSTEMQSTIGKLEDHEWVLSDLRISTSVPSLDSGKGVEFNSVSYHFSRSDKLTGESFLYPKEIEVQKVFDKWGLMISDFEYSRKDPELQIYFGSMAYAGELPKTIEDCFETVCHRFGFESFNYESIRPTMVTFFYED